MTSGKRILLFITLLITFTTVAQKPSFPFYEQIVLDFYSTKILDSFPVKKRINISRHTTDIHKSLFSSGCLPNTTQINSGFSEFSDYTKNFDHFDFDYHILDVSKLGKKKFKILNRQSKRYPRLFITPPNTKDNDVSRLFMTITEEHSKTKGTNYYFELSPDGSIINWCRNEYEIHIDY